MARYNANDTVVQLQALKDQRERDDRAAVASGNVDKNSALYRHAKLNGWDLGGKDELHGPARANAVARDAAATDLVEQRAAGAPRSPISTFAADGEGNFSFYNEDNALRAGFDGIMANANAQKADRARRGRATLGSIVGHAMRNGGMVPRELAQSVGMELGQPGFVGGTLTKDGTFMSLGQGKDGSIQPTGLVSAPDVLKAMVDSGNWRDAFQFDKKYMQMYTPEQKKAVTGFSPQWAQEAQSKEDANNKKIVLQGLFDIAKQQKDRQPMTAREAWQRGMSDPKFIEAWMTKPNPDEVSAEQTPRIPLETEEEVAAAMKKFETAYGELESGGGKEAMNPFQERILAIADRVLGPAPVDPNVAEMRQRAAARANVIDAAGGRQTGFYYRNRSGGLTATNGYVVGGKAYDRYGNLMQGVQPLDYQGNPISGNAPDDAEVRTPAQSAQPPRNDASPLPSVGAMNGASAAQPAQAAATPSIGKDGNLIMQDGTVVKPGATFTNKNGVTMRWKGGDINAWEPVGDKGGKSVLEPLKQVNGGATTSQQDIQNPAPQKPNDDSGKRWNAYISATLREAFPSDEITPDAIASGAYDDPIAQIAKESNDPAFAKYVDDLLKRNSESRQKKDAEKAAEITARANANYEKELKLNRIRKAKPKSTSPITDSFIAVPMP